MFEKLVKVGASIGAYVCAPLAFLIGGFCLIVSIPELIAAARGQTLFHGPTLLLSPIVGLVLGVSAGTRLGRYGAAASAASGIFVIATNFLLSMELGRGPLRDEFQAIGDIRAVISAQGVFASINAGMFAGEIECLSRPGECFADLSHEVPRLVDEGTTRLGLREGYKRSFHAGPAVVPPDLTRTDGGPLADGSVAAYAFVAVRVRPFKKARNFCGDATGVVCYTENGAIPIVEEGRCVQCTPLD